MSDQNPTTSTSEDVILKQLEYEKKLADLRRDILTAQTSLLTQTQIPAYNKTADSTVELSNIEIEAYLTSMLALENAAQTIAEKIKDYKDYKKNDTGKRYPIETLIIYNEHDEVAIRQYRVFATFIDLISKRYDYLLSITPELTQSDPSEGVTEVAQGGSLDLINPLVVAPLVGSALQSVANVMSFFRTDIKVTGIKVEPTEEALVSSFIQYLHTHKTQDESITVYYPALFPLKALEDTQGFSKKLSEIQEKRQQAETDLMELEKSENKSEFQRIIDELKSINTVHDQVVKGLFNSSDGVETNGLMQLIRGANLLDEFNNGAHWLHLKVQKAGGNIKTKTGGILKHSDLICSGGAVVTYMVVDPDMSIVLSGQVLGYVAEQELKNLVTNKTS